MGAPWTVAGALLASGCSLTMLDPVDCADDAGCVEVFGLGATCGASGSCELAVVPSDATLSGYVERAVDLAPGNDGIGTLYVGIYDVCAPDRLPPLNGAFILSADLSSPSARVPYSVAGLPRAKLQLTLFLDDDGTSFNGDGNNAPTSGDLVYGFDDPGGKIECVEIDLTEGYLGYNVSLNLIEP